MKTRSCVATQVYATAGADEKHEFLRSMGVKYITSSRNGAKFEEDMKAFLAEVGDDGIDVVLNSLSASAEPVAADHTRACSAFHYAVVLFLGTSCILLC